MSGSPLDGAPLWLKLIVLPFVLVSDAKYAVRRKLRRMKDARKEAVQAEEVKKVDDNNTM